MKYKAYAIVNNFGDDDFIFLFNNVCYIDKDRYDDSFLIHKIAMHIIHYHEQCRVKSYIFRGISGAPYFINNLVRDGYRCLYYMDDPEQDLFVVLDIKKYASVLTNKLGVMLFSPNEKGFEDIDDAINDYIKNYNEIEVRGFNKKRPYWHDDPNAKFRKILRRFDLDLSDIKIKSIRYDIEKQLHLRKYSERLDFSIGKHKISVSKHIFERWALDLAGMKQLGPEWDAISPEHLKIYNDNRYHSDWLIDAGVDLENAYIESIKKNKKLWKEFIRKYWDEANKIQEVYMRHYITPLFGRGVVRGVVVHPKPDQEVKNGSIIVIPNAGVEYYIPSVCACKNGGAVITEIGGSGCHLAIHAREKNFGLAILQNALSKIPEGVTVIVNFDYNELIIVKE